MKLLFVIYSYYPYYDASTNCLNNVIKYMLSRNEEIHVLSMKYDFNLKENEEYEKVNIHRVFNLYGTSFGKFLKEYNENEKNFLKRYIKIFSIAVFKVFRRIEKLFQKGSVDTYEKKLLLKKIEYLNKEHNFDSIISVSEVFCTSMATAEYFDKCKSKKRTKFLIYMLDPFFKDESIRLKYKKEDKKIEEYVFNKADKIFTTDLIYDECKKNKSINLEKINVIKFPLLVEHKIQSCCDDIELDKNYINCVYVGRLYKTIRRPEYLLSIFSKINKNKKIRLVIIGSGMEEDLEKYKTEMGEQLCIYKEVSKEAAFNAMLNSNILINIGNTILNQMPSKIIDYISMGKPIINLYKIDNCPTLKYTKDYELALNIKEGQDITKSLIKNIEEFCIKNKENKVDFEKLRSIYKECTPEYVSKKFMEIIKS